MRTTLVGKSIKDHPIYLKYMETNLFIEQNDGFVHNKLSLIDGPQNYKLIISIFSQATFPNYICYWQKESHNLGNFVLRDTVSFEEVFEKCSEELQTKMLFHLDLLIIKSPDYYIVDKGLI